MFADGTKCNFCRDFERNIFLFHIFALCWNLTQLLASITQFHLNITWALFSTVFFQVIQISQSKCTCFSVLYRDSGAGCFSAWEIPASRRSGWGLCSLLLPSRHFLKPQKTGFMFLYRLQFSRKDCHMYHVTIHSCQTCHPRGRYLFHTRGNWSSKWMCWGPEPGHATWGWGPRRVLCLHPMFTGLYWLTHWCLLGGFWLVPVPGSFQASM